MHELFLELNRERGSTLLVVTHNPDLAGMMPRKLRMIDGGTIVDESAATSSKAAAVASDSAPAEVADPGASRTTGGTI
jgi:ABC-type thiamine transport system ATPase subunit